jgi:hypothetical protein
MLVQAQASTPTFDLVDLSSADVKTSVLTIPTDIYSDPATVGIAHTFQINGWDDGGRYVLIKHTFGDKDEWLVLDTQDIESTKNITRLLDFAISSIYFSGTSGNIFYALSGSDVRKLDLSARTISSPLVSGVSKFSLYGSNVITYVGVNNINQRVVGLYRDGDDKSYILRTIADGNGAPVDIATAHYFNEDYVAIAVGKTVDILNGSYPTASGDQVTSLKILTSQTIDDDIQKISFSPTGEYVLIQSGAKLISYDLEYQSLVSFAIEGNGDVLSVKWLDNNYIWSNRDGNLTIREFDGANMHIINPIINGQDVVLTGNSRYIYSFDKSSTGYQLQRVRMILP